MKSKTILFICLWVVVAAIGICAAEQAVYWHTKYMRAAILLKYYDHRVQSLENKEEWYAEQFAAIEARQAEIHSWRVSVTLASRIGWPAAARYIRKYPLEDVLEEAGF